MEESVLRIEEKLQLWLDGVINVIFQIIESRDPYIAGHQTRVSILAETIAQEMKLTKEQINNIKIAAKLHDMGKNSIPLEILSRQPMVSKLEFEYLKSHVQNGYQILINADLPEKVIAEIVYQHHERMDGSGYPNGLSDDEILLEARVLAVADIFEAAVRPRPHRQAEVITVKEALAKIKEGQGILYDATVVEACLKVFAKGFKFD